jgi:glycosyltransferase involved in cell wall biosynthesis
MNVLYVSDSDTVSGAEIVMLQYLQHFRPPEHRPHVFFRDRNTRLRAALTELGVPFTTTTNYSERIIETTASPSAIVAYVRAFRRVRRELADVIRAHDIDLVHSISYPAALYVALASRTTGVKQIWHEHNIKRLHAFNTRIYRFTAATAARVIGPSDAVSHNLRRAGIADDTAITVYNGIDLSRFRIDDARAAAVRQELGLRPGQPAVGLFGQMLPHKGHATLVQAAPALHARFPDLRCFFVGALENPPYQQSLTAAMAQAGVSDIFSFTGWRRDVPDVVRAMDVIVVATTTQEPAALALMETMAMGRPIVATRTGGTPELVLDGVTGRIFEPGDATQLARHLAELLADPAMRQALGTAGRQRMEAHFSLERHLQQMAAVYRAAASRPAGRPPADTSR